MNRYGTLDENQLSWMIKPDEVRAAVLQAKKKKELKKAEKKAKKKGGQPP